jgi:hypothetical protein
MDLIGKPETPDGQSHWDAQLGKSFDLRGDGFNLASSGRSQVDFNCLPRPGLFRRGRGHALRRQARGRLGFYFKLENIPLKRLEQSQAYVLCLCPLLARLDIEDDVFGRFRRSALAKKC